MKNKEMNATSLAEMKDKYIGKIGTLERDKYEKEIRKEVLKRTIPTISLDKSS